MATTVDLGKVRPVWKGTWSGSTAYEVHDMVKNGVNSYICTTAHTSDASTFSNDSANWDDLAIGAELPLQSGNAGKVLKTDGSSLSWGDGVPDQTGNSGNFLQTDGSSLSWASASAGLKSIQTFTTAGTHTWTKPAGINLIKVYVTGGGGGGGGTRNDVQQHGYPGASGGSGGTAIKLIDVSSVSSVTVTVGAGGAGGIATSGGANASSVGSNGGTSSFGSYCTGTGGEGGIKGGFHPGSVTSSAPGIATGGDLNLMGNGGWGAGDIGGTIPAPAGVASYWGGANRHAITSSPPVSKLGAGGAGACGYSQTTGATGGPGVVVVEEYA